jgi:hypothetical protein
MLLDSSSDRTEIAIIHTAAAYTGHSIVMGHDGQSSGVGWGVMYKADWRVLDGNGIG